MIKFFPGAHNNDDYCEICDFYPSPYVVVYMTGGYAVFENYAAYQAWNNQYDDARV